MCPSRINNNVSLQATTARSREFLLVRPTVVRFGNRSLIVSIADAYKCSSSMFEHDLDNM